MPTTTGNRKFVVVEEIGRDIISDTTDIKRTDGILGGINITGFIDVEKLITIYSGCYKYKTLFLEKKLPFSIVILSLDPPEDHKKPNS